MRWRIGHLVARENQILLYLCGVGEEADLITLNLIFEPLNSGWLLANGITGYNTSLPILPWRNVIVAAGRLSKKLLNIMYQEMIQFGHSAFREMFHPTIALHDGLKAWVVLCHFDLIQSQFKAFQLLNADFKTVLAFMHPSQSTSITSDHGKESRRLSTAANSVALEATNHHFST